MDSLIFELQIIFYFQLFLSANVRHTGVVLRKIILYLEYTFRSENEQISRTISQNYDFRVSRIFAIVNRVGRLRVKQPIFDEKQFQHQMTSCLS